MSYEVAQTIYQQLGGGRFAAMTGVRDFVAGDDFLQLTLPRNASKANRLRITLDRAADLYNVRFYRRTGGTFDRKKLEMRPMVVKEVAAFAGIYCDQLEDIFRQVTRLETRMPRFAGISG